jgi:indole-3-glycerol phosphate synthase
VNKFLEQVIGEKELELIVKRESIPEAQLDRPQSFMPVRDFQTAITGGNRIIAEIKKKSPSVVAFNLPGEPQDVAKLYKFNGASAISIVTDELNFGTALRDVATIRAAVDLPVLVKDFVIDSYQVSEAWASGADCLLLIARILSPASLAALLEQVHRLKMAALVECHDAGDIEKAIAAGARIIGINNRDLSSLRTTLDVTRSLISKIGPEHLAVSESGISEREQIVELTELGTDAFLIGGALLSAEDPGKKLSELTGNDIMGDAELT